MMIHNVRRVRVQVELAFLKRFDDCGSTLIEQRSSRCMMRNESCWPVLLKAQNFWFRKLRTLPNLNSDLDLEEDLEQVEWRELIKHKG
jgi:hypothetical protein